MNDPPAKARSENPASGDATRPRRDRPLAVRRDLRGAFSHPGLRLRSMECAEARFKGEEPGFVYSRYANPTVAMFEERMALLEGAEAARATATGMAAVTASLMSQVKAGDHVVAARALFGACRYIVEDLLPRFGVASTLVDGADLDAMARGDAARDQGSVSRKPDQPLSRRL